MGSVAASKRSVARPEQTKSFGHSDVLQPGGNFEQKIQSEMHSKRRKSRVHFDRKRRGVHHGMFGKRPSRTN